MRPCSSRLPCAPVNDTTWAFSSPSCVNHQITNFLPPILARLTTAMSLESALEDERLEVLKLLENRPSPKPGGGGNTSSISPTTPRSPPLVPRAISPTRSPPRGGQSMGGISSMILAAERVSNSASPPPASLGYNPRSRDSSPHGSFHSTASSSNPAPRLLKDRDKDRDPSAFTPNAGYQFDMIPTLPGPYNRRHGSNRMGKTTANIPASPASSPTLTHAALSYQDTLSSIYTESGPFQPGGMGLPTGSQVGGRQMRLGTSARRSDSPSMHHNRSASPNTGNLSLSPLSSPPLSINTIGPVRTLITENDTVIDLDSAYRRLSDDALRNSGGSLANLPERGGVAAHVRASSGESIARDGGVRLEKDLTFMVGDDGREIAVESSDESDFSSEEDTEHFRGRQAEKPGLGEIGSSETQLSSSKTSLGGVQPQSSKTGTPRRKTMSLLAAAEEERKTVSSRYKVSSLLPAVTVSPPTQTQQNTNRNIIHPNTNFDTRSHLSTPISSDAEADSKDLKRASRLSLNTFPIVSDPETHRVACRIVRGDLHGLQPDPATLRRKQRSYLVATDLSAEAAHALEWTIGTVLRDGDTLLAIYAIDEEGVGDIDPHKIVSVASEGSHTGSSSPLVSNRRKSLERGKGNKSGTSPARSSSLNRQEAPDNTSEGHHYSADNSSVDVLPQLPTETLENEDGKSTTADIYPKDRSKSEQERLAAAEQISTLVTKLLKKTKLQVNVIVEVIHCKSPKHLLTEMIDILEPTLVILGSRGRSALKGVLLGSFSNYLVTKSSVPVMVARKKLKKSKFKHPNPRLINNLSPGTSRTLASAKVD
ncbi:hypothetical protein TWF696_002726 [Orbilia brochopaga]|uniref:UspA domain-containing protein n=1 Tax=Orbilia brochopaga TaxID=3140254 RepID=A0AAV9U0B9_9PEZI